MEAGLWRQRSSYMLFIAKPLTHSHQWGSNTFQSDRIDWSTNSIYSRYIFNPNPNISNLLLFRSHIRAFPTPPPKTNSCQVSWLARPPQSEEGMGSNPAPAFLCGVCMISPCLRGYSSRHPILHCRLFRRYIVPKCEGERKKWLFYACVPCD